MMDNQPGYGYTSKGLPTLFTTFLTARRLEVRYYACTFPLRGLLAVQTLSVRRTGTVSFRGDLRLTRYVYIRQVRICQGNRQTYEPVSARLRQGRTTLSNYETPASRGRRGVQLCSVRCRATILQNKVSHIGYKFDLFLLAFLNSPKNIIMFDLFLA